MEILSIQTDMEIKANAATKLVTIIMSWQTRLDASLLIKMHQWSGYAQKRMLVTSSNMRPSP